MDKAEAEYRKIENDLINVEKKLVEASKENENRLIELYIEKNKLLKLLADIEVYFNECKTEYES